MDEKQAILNLYNRMQKAMIEKDLETLNQIVLDGTKFVHMSGRVQTKQEFFEEIANGTLNYYKTELKDVKITVNDNSATLACTAYLTAKVYGMSGTFPMNVNANFIKINGSWYYTNKTR